MPVLDNQPPCVGEPPDWDEELAETLRGSYAIVGITYVHPNGEFDCQIQMHGRVSVATAAQGICIALEGQRDGEFYWLPPALDAFEAARPGEYRLRSTGEVIVDPDYTSSWTITRPAQS